MRVTTAEKNDRLVKLIGAIQPPMTVQQAARAIGVSEPTLYNLVNRRRRPTQETAERIAKFFRVRVENVFDVVIPSAETGRAKR